MPASAASSSERHELRPRGPFSLQAAADFGFGPNQGRPARFLAEMRLAFPVDGGRGYAGTVLRQPEPDGPVEVELTLAGGASAPAALRQVERIVSLDGDGDGFMEVGERDPVIGRLQEIHHGQRPVLFHSPYEAAAWSIISARRSSAQGAAVRARISAAFGEAFELAGETVLAFPGPDRLLELPEDTRGLGSTKVERLHGVARAAIEGRLGAARLRELGHERAFTEVQELKGLGPMYAGLVVLRSTGMTDAPLMALEPKVFAHIQRFYALPEPLTLERYVELAEVWRPFRTWATVLLRLGGNRGA